jgi:hypothetical protein
MENHNYFDDELKLIENEQVRDWVINQLDYTVPDYFYHVAASSTGKYHPKYALGEGGLMRHTKAAVGISKELIELEMFGKLKEQYSYIVAALILHDTFKHGLNYSKYATAKHPLVASKVYRQDRSGILDQDQIDFICDLIETHMGQWNTDWKTKEEILEKPKTQIQKFVHLCDYLASRKQLEYIF